MSVRPSACNNSAPAGRSVEKMLLKSDKITRGLYMKTNVYFLVTSRSVLPRMKNISGKSCRDNQNTRFIFLFIFEDSAVYEIMWNNAAQRGSPQMPIWRMRIACWITRTTNTQSGYVIFIVCLLQQCLSDGASILRHTYSP
jgi:hypothetical protein